MINMDLESTIVTINNLLKLDFESSFSDFIQPQKQLMAIPNYQREYKWEKSKIKTFVDNVMQRSKFLGIITVEAPISNFLSLVDGQQRLTTIILMLAQLYNACADEDETETQDEISLLSAERFLLATKHLFPQKIVALLYPGAKVVHSFSLDND